MSLEPNAATDLLVAKAAGIPTKILSIAKSLFGGSAGYEDVCHKSSGRLKGYTRFSPTTNLRHAMEAAEAVGLFDASRQGLVYWKEAGKHWVGHRSTYVGKSGPTPELAICEAILAMAKAKEPDTE